MTLNLSYDEIQTPEEVWNDLLKLNRIPEHSVFYEPFSGKNSLYNQVDCKKKYRTEITEGLDVFDFDFIQNDDVNVIYTNPPYKASIPDKKGNYKVKNCVYFFLDYFMNNFHNLHTIGFIINSNIFNSLTPTRLKKLKDKYGFIVTRITIFNTSFWYGCCYFIVFKKDPIDTSITFLEKVYHRN